MKILNEKTDIFNQTSKDIDQLIEGLQYILQYYQEYKPTKNENLSFIEDKKYQKIYESPSINPRFFKNKIKEIDKIYQKLDKDFSQNSFRTYQEFIIIRNRLVGGTSYEKSSYNSGVNVQSLIIEIINSRKDNKDIVEHISDARLILNFELILRDFNSMIKNQKDVKFQKLIITERDFKF